jgi:hypothetical protein
LGARTQIAMIGNRVISNRCHPVDWSAVLS